MSPGKYMGKYCNDSFRYNKFDYSESATYFITILTYKRQNSLAKIENRDLVLTKVGEIVETEWLRGPTLRPDMNIKLGEYSILPDHFHAIINIGKNQFNSIKSKDAMPCVPTPAKTVKNKFGPQLKNLASIIRGFKASVTIKAKGFDPEFRWHKLYYDKILRDRLEFEISTKYINENKGKWLKDNQSSCIG